MLYLNQIIRCCSKFSKCFLCFNININFMVTDYHKFGYSVLVATKFFNVTFLTSNMVIHKEINLTCFYQRLSCFIMLVFNGWQQQRRNLIFLWMNITNNGVQEGHGLMRQFFRFLMSLYLRNYFSHHINIDMILCVNYMPTKK